MRDPIRDYDSRDLNDFKDWSVMDIADLKNHAEFGASLKEVIAPELIPCRHIRAGNLRRSQLRNEHAFSRLCIRGSLSAK